MRRDRSICAVVNYVLMIGCLALVLGFRSSDALGAAYGLAVIGTMAVTSVTFYVVTRQVWGWSRGRALPLLAAFLVVDGAFLVANLAKLLSGAWVPLLIGGLVFAVLATWTLGRSRFRQAMAGLTMPLEEFRQMARSWEQREPGGAVFLTENLDKVPMMGKHPWLRAHVRHEATLLLRVETTRRPHVPPAERLTIEDMGGGIYRGTARFGFMHPPDVSAALADALPFEWDQAVFFLPLVVVKPAPSWWRGLFRRLYLFLAQTGLTPVEYFQLPARQVVSVGVELNV